MIETINGKAYVKKGDKVYEVGGGGTNFIFANSKEELPDPSTVPENSVGLVPSEESAGGGGLPVVELETPIINPETSVSALTESDIVKMNAVLNSATPFILSLQGDGMTVRGVPDYAIITNEGVAIHIFSLAIQKTSVSVMYDGETWFITYEE